MASAFPLYIPEYAAYVLMGLWVLVCVMFVALRKITALICALLLAGVTQNLLIALFGQTLFSFVDDVPAGLLILVAVFHAWGDWTKRNRIAFGLLVFTVFVIMFAAVRGGSLGEGLNQARQVLVPVGLVFTGYVLWDRINWSAALKFAGVLGFFVAGWVIIEGLMQAPIVHPTASVQLRMGDRPVSVRGGLPSSYYADGISSDGTPVFRPGGPFMNPPMVGFFLGLATLAYARYRNPFLRWVGFVAVAIALAETFARAGILLALSVTVAYWAWRVAGRVVTTIGLLLAVVVLFGEVAGQGNTASHSNGLVDGLFHGLRSVVGDGFGGFGYQASSEAGDNTIGESLFGLYFSWMGIPMIVLVGWLIVRLARQLLNTTGRENQIVWFAVGFVVAAALSETASALTATGLSWMLVGLALAKELRPAPDAVEEVPVFLQQIRAAR